LYSLNGHTGYVFGVAFSPGGASLVTASMDRTAKLWDLTPSHELAALVTNSDAVSGVAISPDCIRIPETLVERCGTKLAIAGRHVEIWDLVTGKRLYQLKGHTNLVDSVKFSPDGTRLATAAQDEAARVWDLATGRELLILPAGQSGNVAVAFSPDGRQLAMTGKENTIAVWDTASGEEVLTLLGHTAPVVQLVYDSAGTRLATVSEASEDGIKIWDVATGTQLLGLQQTNVTFSIAFSPDRKSLATGNAEGMAALWDVSTGKQLYSLFGHTRPVFSVAFTPDGSRLVTASGDGTLKIWDTSSGEELLTLQGHTGRVFGVAISPDGTRLATAGQDGISRIYLLRLDDLVELARTRVTRSLTIDECKKFLHRQECPAAP
jgi:WD40 repeat protein